MAARRPRADSEQSLYLQMPTPSSQVASYTFEKVAKTRAFADYCLKQRRIISPISEQLFTILRTSCDAFMDASTRDFKGYNEFALKSQIRKFETEIQDRVWLRQAPTKDQEDATAQLVRARRQQIYIRYGDYLAHMCHKLRLAANLHKTPDRDLLSRQNRWSAIADIISSQLRERKRREESPAVFGRPEDQECWELRALYAAAEAGGIDAEQALFAVQAYGDRNQSFHTSLEDSLEDGDHAKIKMMLASDLSDINSVVPVELTTERQMLTGIIETLINTWCTRTHMVPMRWGESEAFIESYVTPAELRHEEKKAFRESRDKKRVIEQKQLDAKVKADQQKQKLLDQIEAYLIGHPPAGLQDAVPPETPKQLHESREEVYATIRSLSHRAGRRYRWSLRREAQLQQIYQDSKSLEKALAEKKDLSVRYKKERDSWRASAISIQKQAGKHAQRYIDAGFLNPPPTLRELSPSGTASPSMSEEGSPANVPPRMRSRARSPLRADTFVSPSIEEVAESSTRPSIQVRGDEDFYAEERQRRGRERERAEQEKRQGRWRRQ